MSCYNQSADLHTLHVNIASNIFFKVAIHILLNKTVCPHWDINHL